MAGARGVAVADDGARHNSDNHNHDDHITQGG